MCINMWVISTCQPDDQHLSAAWAASISCLIITCQPVDQHLSSAWSATLSATISRLIMHACLRQALHGGERDVERKKWTVLSIPAVNLWKWKLLSHIWLCDPMAYCSPPGSFVHGLVQARVLEWVVVPFSRGSSQPRDQTQVSCIAGGFLTFWATRE